MEQINRWILSCQNRVVNVWYNQDRTVYGLNPTVGPQQPDNSNTVAVYLLDYGDPLGLRCAGNPGQGIPSGFVAVDPGAPYQLHFQAPDGSWNSEYSDEGYEMFGVQPTGDGYFALYSRASNAGGSFYGNYVAIDPNPDSAAGNCNALVATAGHIDQAARFYATGVDRPSVFDFLETGSARTPPA